MAVLTVKVDGVATLITELQRLCSAVEIIADAFASEPDDAEASPELIEFAGQLGAVAVNSGALADRLTALITKT